MLLIVQNLIKITVGKFVISHHQLWFQQIILPSLYVVFCCVMGSIIYKTGIIQNTHFCRQQFI